MDTTRSSKLNVATFLLKANKHLNFSQRLTFVVNIYTIDIRKRVQRFLSDKPLFFIYKGSLKSTQEWKWLWRYLKSPNTNLSFFQRLSTVVRFFWISLFVASPHEQYEILTVFESILTNLSGDCNTIVEAGCYKGGSTAKLSLAARMADCKLLVFDSFEGLPQHNEKFRPEGTYRGNLEEVRKNIVRFGAIEVCQFIKGWFADTMVDFKEPIRVLFLDVDLAASTQTCLKYLYPNLVPGGMLYSHDGHIKAVMEVYNCEKFWKEKIGCPKPRVERIGKRLVQIVKVEE
jgi:O-methyltransferase